MRDPVSKTKWVDPAEGLDTAELVRTFFFNTTKCLMSKFVLANMKLPQRGGAGQRPWVESGRLRRRTNYLRTQGGEQGGPEARG